MNHTIRKVELAGTNGWMVTTAAGLSGVSGSLNGAGTGARFNTPRGVALDSSGNIYVADTLNNTIRKVTAAGVVTNMAGLAGESGHADGSGNAARFNSPYGIAVDSAGNVYVADTLNHTIRQMTPAGRVTTLAGLPGRAGIADALGSVARLRFPTGLALDEAGNLFVADTGNHVLRKLIPEGTNWRVTTVSGWTGGAALIQTPRGVSVDAAGHLYMVDLSGIIQTGVPAPRIIGSRFIAGQFGINFTAPLGYSVVVEASSDLRNWSPVWTNILTGSVTFEEFRDPETRSYSRRFYRTHLP